MSLKYILPVGLSAWLITWWGQGMRTSANHYPINTLHAKQYALSNTKPTQLVRQDVLKPRTPLDTPVTPKPVRYERFKPPRFVPKDRYGDPIISPSHKSRLIYGQPSTLKTNIKLFPDSTGNNFLIDENLGQTTYRPPTILSMDEIAKIQEERERKKYWQDVAFGTKNSSTLGSKKSQVLIPPIKTPLGVIKFTTTGFLNLDFGVQSQRVANPTLPIRQQRNTNFNFDPHLNISLTGQVGDRLKISLTQDTKSSFQFQNNFKVEYTPKEEDIIQKLDFGNVSFPLQSTLIPGAQNLFGLTTELRFGRLFVRGVYSNQRAQADQIVLQGGAQRRNFEIRADKYEQNRHFFLSHFFRNQYETWLSGLPVVTSGLNITRVEVYVTNRTNNTQTLRNIVGLQDLGENSRIGNTNAVTPVGSSPVATNDANNLFGRVSGITNADQATQQLESTIGLRNNDDFVILRGARKLTDAEYTVNRQLGYISLNAPVKNDEIIAVSFEYTFNGQSYKVGELSEDYQDRGDDEVIYLKMLRPSAIRVDLPSWDLMMKNIYSLDATQVSQENFQLRIIYKDDLTGIDNPSLQEGIRTKDIPLLQIMNLDNLNQQNDPQRDGNFDYISGITVDPNRGKIIFPVLEPFGSLNLVIGDRSQGLNPNGWFDPVTEVGLVNKYVFDELYRTTQADALQAANKNKFFLAGSFEASSSNDVTLPGINIAEGSVRVTAGNTPLVEGTDYTVDYASGRVTIINEAILNSGKEIKIDYEKADLFNFQTRRLFGTRLDYHVNKDFVIGATYLNLRERPVITRTNIGEEPTSNSIWGFDINYKSDSRFLTRLVDKIPLIQTKEKSSIEFNAEFAQLRPGASPISGQTSYIDDFEGTRTAFNLVRQANVNWKLGSTPLLIQGSGASTNDLSYTFRRAKMAWYNIDNLFYNSTNNRNKPDNITSEDLENHFIRAVSPQEISRGQSRLLINTNEVIFDVAYFPTERGPYNYNTDVNPDGSLKNPTQNFGAITRAITTDIDFDNANVEYLEFWMMSPYIDGPKGQIIDGKNPPRNFTTSGDLYINLGNVSEDVIKDGRHAFENGLPTDGANAANSDQTPWGFVTNQQYLTNAFDNTARGNQDVGLDGLKSVTSNQEREFFQAYLQALQGVVTDQNALLAADNDPSSDDFQYYLGDELDARDAKILERYKNFNGLENNSPTGSTVGNFNPSSTNTPDNEDLNADNTVSDLEAYYQYKISIRREDFRVGRNYIVDKVEGNTEETQGSTWYLFRIPIREFDSQVGNIQGFKSIRFLRMFMTNFQQPVVLRFADYQLVSNQWRRYLEDLSDKTLGQPIEPYDANFTVATINIEDNGGGGTGNTGEVTPYVLPPGVIRDQDRTTQNNQLFNEQSIQMSVEGLRNRDARAVFKNVNMDFISYKRIRMFVHAESRDPNTQDDQVSAFVRVGTDFTQNYYEIEVPLKLTPIGTSASEVNTIWPDSNNIDVAFEDLYQTKLERNSSFSNVTIPYTRQVGRYRITVVGNPDMSAIQTVMLGMRNPDLGAFDDKQPKSVVVWMNELRVAEFDQTAGWAALARLKMQLADFAQITASGKYSTFGFGNINQKISQRARERTYEYDISANVALDKFIPEKVGLKIPLFVSYERSNISPQFNPLDPDVPLSAALQSLESDEARQAYRRLVEDNTERRSINFTNVRKVKTNPKAKSNFWDIENLSATWALSEETRSNINIQNYLVQNQKWSLAYTFQNKMKPWAPFQKSSLFKSPWLALIKDFNLNFLPTSITIRGDLDRSFRRTQLRNSDLTTQGILPTFEKLFTFNRLYNISWNLSRNLTLTYNATANALIDEPFGDLDTDEKRDSVLNNIRKLGRMKNFTQTFGVNYKLPLDKIPLTAWITATANYNAGYNWTAGSLRVVDTLGNLIQNTRQRGINTNFNFRNLYRKVKFLKRIDGPARRTKKPKNYSKLPADRRKRIDSIARAESRLNVLRAFVRPLLSLRTVSVKYSINEQTQLAGFNPLPRFFGQDSTFTAPGWDFVLGGQSPDIKTRAVQNDWLAVGNSLNTPFTQSLNENLSIRALIEPFNGLKIQLEARKSRTANYQELFRNVGTQDDPVFESQTPVLQGSYRVSYIALNTSFISDNDLNESPIFQTFSDNRAIVRDRLRRLNNTGAGEYSTNSQDVLIPAFLAAYTGASPDNVNLSAFPAIPLPNWQVTYSGLSKIEPFKSLLSSFTLRHSYNSNYNVDTYTSSLEYGGEFLDLRSNVSNYIIPNQVTANGEYVPVYVIGSVSLQEKFSPVIGVNVRTNGNLTIRVDYNRERNLTLNLNNRQVTEINNKDFVVGIGYNKKGLRLPFKSGGEYIVLKNDLNLRLDLTIRDTKTVQRKLDDVQTITGGNINFQLKPVISYMVNSKLNFQFYFERNINTPRISSSFPRSATNVGFQLRYNLAQ